MTMFSSKVQNLFRKYPDEFMREYRGCTDLDCIPGCNISNAHCERIAIAFAEWQATLPPPHRAENIEQEGQGQ